MWPPFASQSEAWSSRSTVRAKTTLAETGGAWSSRSAVRANATLSVGVSVGWNARRSPRRARGAGLRRRRLLRSLLLLTLHEDRYERLRHDDDGRWHLDGAGVGWRHWRRVARHVPVRRVRAELHGTRVLRVCDGPRPAAALQDCVNDADESDDACDEEHKEREIDQWPRVCVSSSSSPGSVGGVGAREGRRVGQRVGTGGAVIRSTP